MGDEFFSLGLRVSRSFRFGDRTRLEAMAEVFNLTNAVNETARNTTFGTGAYPTNPSPTYNQVTAVGDPAQLAVLAAAALLAGLHWRRARWPASPGKFFIVGGF